MAAPAALTLRAGRGYGRQPVGAMTASPFAVAAVLERNRRVGERIARILAAAIDLQPVSCVDDAAALRDVVGPTTRLVACGEADIDRVGDWFCSIYPELRFLVWTSESPARVLQFAAGQPRLSSILGWPRFQSMPRAWELGMAARRLVLPATPAPDLPALLQWGATVVQWTPRTTVDRDRVVADVARIAADSGTDAKTAERVAALAHELLMNAMYDAPVDRDGQPRYAFDRGRDVVLEDAERPALRLITDGVLLAIEVRDPFGGLQRRHVVDGIARVLGAQSAASGSEIVDASHGGAGLGMARLYTDSVVLLADVVRGRSTRVVSMHDLSMSAREMRGVPGSLHYFCR